MTTIRTILHPTDFSAQAEAALALAAATARGSGAKLLILHVAPGEPFGEGKAEPGVERSALGELRDRVVGGSPGFPVETCLREGHPADEILKAADDLGADLIVMGSHGRTSPGRDTTGGVTEEVVRRAGCPVAVAHPSAAAAVAARGASPAPGRVLVTEGQCGCGVPNVHVIHRDYPEHWAEGLSPAEGAANLEARLARAQAECPNGWHFTGLARAIEEVRAFRDKLLHHAAAPAAEKHRGKTTV